MNIPLEIEDSESFDDQMQPTDRLKILVQKYQL